MGVTGENGAAFSVLNFSKIFRFVQDIPICMEVSLTSVTCRAAVILPTNTAAGKSLSLMKTQEKVQQAVKQA